MDFYTVVLRQSHGFWVALCLENGIVGQADSQDGAIAKLKEAIESVQLDAQAEMNSTVLSIQELHEFLTVAAPEPTAETYELRAVYA
jgi:predicted RNase H-like HicB family nuclease